jgi:hypothetical protein
MYLAEAEEIAEIEKKGGDKKGGIIKRGAGNCNKVFLLVFLSQVFSLISTLFQKSLSRWSRSSTFLTPRLIVIGSRLK